MFLWFDKEHPLLNDFSIQCVFKEKADMFSAGL